jgi:hypothetical protein
MIGGSAALNSAPPLSTHFRMRECETVRFGMVQVCDFMSAILLIYQSIKYIGLGGIHSEDDVIGCRRTGERKP